MTRLSIILFISLLALLSACSESSEVEEVFTAITNLHLSDNREGIKDHFDYETHRFIEQLVDNAKNREADKANYLGQQNEIPIGTMILYYALAGTDERPDSSSLFSEDFLWVYFMLDGTGVFRHTKEMPIRIHDDALVYGDVARLSVAVPTGNNALLGTTYRFNREDEKWKLNLASTMELMEKIHKQNQRSSGLDLRDYAKQAGLQSGEGLEFKYRKY